MQTDEKDNEELMDLILPLAQEIKIIKFLKKRQEKSMPELVSDLTSKIGFYKIFNLFEKYTLLTIEFKNLQQKFERNEQRNEQNEAIINELKLKLAEETDSKKGVDKEK